MPAAEAEVCREDLSAEVWWACPLLLSTAGDLSTRLFQERLVQATKAKEEGNTYFKAGEPALRPLKFGFVRPWCCCVARLALWSRRRARTCWHWSSWASRPV